MPGIDDAIAFLGRLASIRLPYVWAMLAVAICALANLCSERRTVKRLALIAIAALVLFSGLHLSLFVNRHWLVSLLGSEDDYAAEVAYSKLSGRITLSQLRALALDQRDDPNVRFYAIALLADKLASTHRTNELHHVEHELSTVGRLRPRFFSTNSINVLFDRSKEWILADQVFSRRLASQSRPPVGQ